MTFIYALRDPHEDQYRYVGKAADPKSRMASHLWAAKYEASKRAEWIRGLIEAGIAPIMDVLEEVENGREAEARWIARLLQEGHPLLNVQKNPQGGSAGSRGYAIGFTRSACSARLGVHVYKVNEGHSQVWWDDNPEKQRAAVYRLCAFLLLHGFTNGAEELRLYMERRGEAYLV